MSSEENGLLSSIRSELTVFYWFFYRTLVQQLSFRSWFVMRILGTVVGVTTFAIFAQVIPSDAVNTAVYERYGISGPNPFMTWFLIGMLIQNMISLGGTRISRLVNSPFYPYYHSSPTKLATVLLGNSSFRYTWIAVETLAYIFVGSLFGLKIFFNLGFLAVLLTGILMIFSLDLLAAGWNVITKTHEDPLNWFLNLFSRLVSGTWIPVWELPNWLQWISNIHPQYYINEMARHTLGGNASIAEIWPQLAPLLGLTALILVVGYKIFQYGFWKARNDGTLGHAMSGWHGH